MKKPAIRSLGRGTKPSQTGREGETCGAVRCGALLEDGEDACAEREHAADTAVGGNDGDRINWGLYRWYVLPCIVRRVQYSTIYLHVTTVFAASWAGMEMMVIN